MKTLRRSLLIVLLTVGAGACSTPIMGPDDAEQYNPDSGNYNPDSGNYNPDSGNYNPGSGNYNPGSGN